MGVQINGDTGNISATKADYSGNVTIGGTLTYEDVTNVDSIGIVTAREGIEVGARPGVAASISVDGNMIVSGISTFGGDVQVPDKIIHSGDTDTAIRFPAADTVSVETGGSERVRIDSSGRMGIGDNSPDRELVVKHASSNSTIKIESANTHTSQLMFADSDGEQVGRVAVFHGSGQVTSNSLTLDTAGTARIRVEPAGNVNVSQNLNVAGVCTATSFSGSGANLTGIVAIPSGGIILWSGAANAIPSGFVLCDGNNSTPNLSGKFVVGYDASNGDYDVGDTGGSESVTLTTSQIPSHNHTINYGNTPAGGSRSAALYTSDNQGTQSINSTGGGGSHENRPPYYALCYIMKT